MKYYRFMSQEEYMRMSLGEYLRNNNPHRTCRTGSVGFCFLREDSVAMSDNGVRKLHEDSIVNDARDFLIGTCGSDEVFVEFETDRDDLFKESTGVYADFLSDVFDAVCFINEYSTIEYSTKWLKPVRAWVRTVEYDYVEIPVSYAMPNEWTDRFDIYCKEG